MWWTLMSFWFLADAGKETFTLRVFEFAFGDVFVGRRSNFFLSLAIASMVLYRVANSFFFLYPPRTFSIKRPAIFPPSTRTCVWEMCANREISSIVFICLGPR